MYVLLEGDIAAMSTSTNTTTRLYHLEQDLTSE